MYGLPRDIDLSFLNGREVIQVAVGTYDVIFRFDKDVSVSAVGQFRYFDGESEFNWTPTPDGLSTAGRSLHLLSATVKRFQGSEDGTLVLNFSNGHRLTLLDSTHEYESYTITRPGVTIVV